MSRLERRRCETREGPEVLASSLDSRSLYRFLAVRLLDLVGALMVKVKSSEGYSSDDDVSRSDMSGVVYGDCGPRLRDLPGG